MTFVVSMSGKGNCYDNAVVETFFKTLKAELVWRTSFTTRHEAHIMIGNYIDGFYNPKRRHSTLGYKSPDTVRKNEHLKENRSLTFTKQVQGAKMRQKSGVSETSGAHIKDIRRKTRRRYSAEDKIRIV